MASGFWVSVRSEAQELSGMVAGRRLAGGRLVSTVRGAIGPRRLHKSTGVRHGEAAYRSGEDEGATLRDRTRLRPGAL